MYYAIAYRWGITNNHWYIAAVGPDLDDIKHRAEQLCQDRGGKYGVTVWKHNPYPTKEGMVGWDPDEKKRVLGQVRDWDAEHLGEEMVVHFPSLHGEEAPRASWANELNKELGQEVLHALLEGKPELPDWLSSDYKERFHFHRAFYGRCYDEGYEDRIDEFFGYEEIEE